MAAVHQASSTSLRNTANVYALWGRGLRPLHFFTPHAARARLAMHGISTPKIHTWPAGCRSVLHACPHSPARPDQRTRAGRRRGCTQAPARPRPPPAHGRGLHVIAVGAGAGLAVKLAFIGRAHIRADIVVQRVAKARPKAQAVGIHILEVDGVAGGKRDGIALLPRPEIFAVHAFLWGRSKHPAASAAMRAWSFGHG